MLEKAKEEMEKAGLFDNPNDKFQLAINNFVLKTIREFEEMQHSGATACYTIKLLTTLLENKPLINLLSGKDDEWIKVRDNLWQNNRDAEIFKTSEGAYWMEGIIFEDQNGVRSSTYYSAVSITFPYIKPDQPQIVKYFDTTLYKKEKEDGKDTN